MFKDIPIEINPLLWVFNHVVSGKPLLDIPGVQDSPETMKRLGWADQFEKEHGHSSFMSSYRPGNDAIRDWAVHRYAWAIPTQGVIHHICKIALESGGLLEVHAGSGYWASLIRHAAGDQFPFAATDLTPWNSSDLNHYGHVEKLFTDVEQEDAVESAKRAALNGWALLTVWPSYEDSWTGEMISAYVKHGGQTVIHVGEGEGGCTGGEWFWKLLTHYFTSDYPDEHVETWSIAHDFLQVWSRDATVAIEEKLHDASKYHSALEEQRRVRKLDLENMRRNLDKLNKDFFTLRGEQTCQKDSLVRSPKLVLAPPAKRSKNRRLLIR